MNRKSLVVLGALVIGLMIAVLTLQNGNRNDSATAERKLLPNFSAAANTATTVIASATEDSGDITIRDENGTWVVEERDSYPADVSKLRGLIVAIANARIMEEKTSNPALYAKLGVADPDDDGNGRKVTVSGPDFSHSIIVGDVAQGSMRYARVTGEETSYLIDQNPEIPTSASDWLLPDVIDIDASRIRSVSITHADGEKIVLEKTSREQTDFVVLDIPPDRELSYAAIGNGVAGALSALTLEDVRTYNDAETAASAAAVNTVFNAWDGLTISAEVQSASEQSWVTFAAVAEEVEHRAEASADIEDGTDENAGGSDALSSPADFESIRKEATMLNARLNGWQYQLADTKKNLLVRRWDDILKPLESNQ